MSKKTIGIVAYKLENGIGVTTPYYEYFSQYGDVTLIMPNQKPQVDLLVLPGGADINPARYGRTPRLFTSNPNVLLEYFDEKILPLYIEDKTPIVGICRGMQTLNVFFGGTLYQHLGCHPQSLKRYEGAHEIKPAKEEMLRFFPKKGTKIKVNSMHHQGVRKLGQGIVPLLISEEDNVVECIKHETLRLIGIQWHPEEIYDNISEYLIKKLLKEEE